MQRDSDVCPPVSGLLFVRGPLAVVGLVTSVIVNALDGVAGRLLPHVGKKRREVTQPALADTDAAPAIIRTRHISASLFDVAPDFVLCRSGSAESRPVFATAGAGRLASEAAATSARSGTKRSRIYDLARAAFALTKPLPAPVGLAVSRPKPGILNHSPAAKPLADKIRVHACILSVFALAGCEIQSHYRPVLKFGALREVDRKFGDSGWVGHVTISQPLHYFGKHPSCIAPPSVEALFLHGSDLLRQDDLTTVDAIGPVFSVPLGRVK